MRRNLNKIYRFEVESCGLGYVVKTYLGDVFQEKTHVYGKKEYAETVRIQKYEDQGLIDYENPFFEGNRVIH